MAALRQNTGDGADEPDSLEALVARIQAGDRSTLGPPPSPEAIARFIEHVRDEPPMSREEEEAWNREWDRIEEEMRVRDRANSKAEGRG